MEQFAKQRINKGQVDPNVNRGKEKRINMLNDSKPPHVYTMFMPDRYQNIRAQGYAFRKTRTKIH